MGPRHQPAGLSARREVVMWGQLRSLLGEGEHKRLGDYSQVFACHW